MFRICQKQCHLLLASLQNMHRPIQENQTSYPVKTEAAQSQHSFILTAPLLPPDSAFSITVSRSFSR
jgi:hypothetical protein